MDEPLRNIYSVLRIGEWRTMGITPHVYRIVFICYIVVFISALITADTPCTNCEVYNVMQSQQALSLRSHHQNEECSYPCNCDSDALQCKTGVNKIKDGCACCMMCARQQGDLCSKRYKCDVDKGLYCDQSLDNGRMGYCRVHNGRSCRVNDNTYKDGQQFQLNCSMTCMCQDGHYACSNMCPSEEKPPSSVYCKDPQLVKIQDLCCREWVCPHHHSMPEPSGDQFIQRIDPSEECTIIKTQWSPCSQTCGMGFSTRTTNDNPECQPVVERRLCFVRSCQLRDHDMAGRDCKSTWRDVEELTLTYEGCVSKEKYNLTYCSTCRKHKCCGPDRVDIVPVDFRCMGGKDRTMPFVWIKTCKCFPKHRCPFM